MKWIVQGIQDWLHPERLIEPIQFPPPFQRMLAINSDVEFTSWAAQVDLLAVFAEYKLETAFSYWFFNDPDTTWRLFEPDGSLSKQALSAFRLMRAGLLDTLHSFGGAANGRGTQFNRMDIANGYRVLQEHRILTRIYSNHGTTRDIQNIGGDWIDEQPVELRYQLGDVPGSERYHLDLTLDHGVRFFWVDIDRWRHVNWFTGSEGGARDLFVGQMSRDGNPILRFRRTDAAIDPDSFNLGKQLNRILDDPESGYCVVYTHLGVLREPSGKPIQNQAPYLNEETRQALRRLSQEEAEGKVIITTTAKLLTHALLMAARPWKVQMRNGAFEVSIENPFTYSGVKFSFDWEDLSGLTFQVRTSRAANISLNGESRPLTRWNYAGKDYAGIPWSRIDMKNAVVEMNASA